jgi:hypothetical protein
MLTNWRQILGYRTEPKEFKVGARVRTTQPYHCFNANFPIGTVGTIKKALLFGDHIYVYFDEFPHVPFDVHEIGTREGFPMSTKWVELI